MDEAASIEGRVRWGTRKPAPTNPAEQVNSQRARRSKTAAILVGLAMLTTTLSEKARATEELCDEFSEWCADSRVAHALGS